MIPSEYFNILVNLANMFYPFRIWLVGGSVRDLALGRPINDLDVATDAPPHVSERILGEWGEEFWNPGTDYGTVCAKRGDVTVEVTTLRKDTYNGESRLPKVTFGTDIKDDLKRRDFTINAMALEIGKDGWTNYVCVDGAEQDLENLILRTPDSAAKSFLDDPLRMLRAARFVSQIPGLTVSLDITTTMATFKSQLDRISRERISAELDKTLLGEDPYHGLMLLDMTGVLDHVAPDALPFNIPVAPVLATRWALFLIFTEDPAKVLRDLKHTAKLIKDVPAIIDNVKHWTRLNMGATCNNGWDMAGVRRVVWRAGDVWPNVYDIISNLGVGPQFVKLYELMGHPTKYDLRQPLSGDDVMRILGIKPGKLVGQALSHLQEAVLNYGQMDQHSAEHELLLWWNGKA